MPRLPKSNPPVSTAQLAAAQEQFVQAWGQMGPSWGVSRTMAEVHALLYITGDPLNTDDVMDKLRISRGNASMSLRALVEWGLIERIHLRGDRKEYFRADADAWSMARAVIRERLRREILPLLASLYDIRDQTGEHADAAIIAAASKANSDPTPPASPDAIRTHNERLDAMVSLMQTVDRLGERFVGSEGKGLKLAATLLSKVI